MSRLNEADNPGAPVPVDLVTTSASGLDPHISPAAAEFQVKRIAKTRGLMDEQVRTLIARHTEQRQWGFMGEPRVNVLELNLDLDANFRRKINCSSCAGVPGITSRFLRSP